MTEIISLQNLKCFVFGLSLNGNGSGTALTELGSLDKPQWLHLDYTEVDCEKLLKETGVPGNIIESLLRLDSRPRTLLQDEGLFLALRTVNANPGESPEDMVSIRFWLQKNRLISVRQRIVFSALDIKADLENGIGPKDLQDLVANFIERIANRISDYVDLLEEKLEVQENSVDIAEPNKLRKDVSRLRRHAAGVRRFLAPQRDALDSLARQSSIILNESTLYFIHEQSDRIIRYIEDLDLLRERAMMLQEELMNRVAQEQNARMYVLSIVAAIFLPISFVTGLFGMNVAGLPGVEYPWAFMLVAGSMLAVVVVTLTVFRLKKWL